MEKKGQAQKNHPLCRWIFICFLPQLTAIFKNLNNAKSATTAIVVADDGYFCNYSIFSYASRIILRNSLRVSILSG